MVIMWPFAGAGVAALVIGTNGDDGGRPEGGPGGLSRESFTAGVVQSIRVLLRGAQLIFEVPRPLAAGSTQLVVSD